MTRKQKIILNIISNAIPFIIIFFLGMEQTRIFKKNYSEELATSIGVAKSMITWILIIEGGFIAATSQSLYKPLASKNYSEVFEKINGLKKVYQKIAMQYLIILIFLSFFFKPTVITILVGIVPFINFYYNPYRTLLISNQQGYISFLLANLTLIITMVLTILFAPFIAIEILLIITILINLLLGMITKYIVLKLYKNLKNSKTYILPSKKMATANLIHSISGLVFSSTDLLLIRWILGISKSFTFIIYTQVTLALRSLLRIVLEGFQASLANLMNEDENKFQEMFEIFIILSFWLGISASVSFVLGINPFIKAYYPKDDYTSLGLSISLSFLIFLELIRTPLIHLEYMCKLTDITAKFAVFEAIFNIVLSIVLIYKLGAYGAVIATGIAFVLDLIIRSFFVYQYNVTNYYKKMITLLFSSAIILIIASYISSILKINSTSRTITFLYMILYFIITFIIYGFILFIIKRKQLKMLFNQIKQMVRKNI